MDDIGDIVGSALTNSSQAQASFKPGASYGTPVAVLDNLQRVESSGNPYAVNKDTKAMGPYQFTPDTVAALHKQGVKFNPFDPVEARSAADYYLQQLASKNGGDLNKAVAAYGGFKSKDPSEYVGKVVGDAPAPNTQGVDMNDIATLLTTPQADNTPNVAQQMAATQPAPQEDAWHNFNRGIDLGVNQLLLGAKQLLDRPAQWIERQWPAITKLNQTLGLPTADQAAQNTASVAAQMERSPELQTTAGKVGNAVGQTALMAAVPVGGSGGLVGTAMNGAKIGALAGATQPVTDEGNLLLDKAKNTAAGGLLGTAGGLVAYPALKAAGGIVSGLVNAGRSLVDSTPEEVAAALKTASPQLQEAVRNATGPIDKAALGRQLEADSLPVPITLTQGQASQNPIQISMERNARSIKQELAMHYNAQNQNLIDNMNHVLETGAPNAVGNDHITSGQYLINAGQKVLDTADAKTKGAYEALAASNGGNIPIDGQAFAIKANEALGGITGKGPFLPAQVQNILNTFQKGEQQMSLGDYENLRTILGNIQRGGDGNAAGAASTVRDVLENMPITAEAGPVKALADQARAAAREGFSLRDSVPALKAIDSGQANSNNFIQSHIVNGTPESIEKFRQLMAADPAALDTMKGGVLDWLKTKAGVINDNGNFSASGYNRALKTLGPKLDALFGPDETGTLRTLGNVARYQQAQPAGSFVNNSNTDVSNAARTAGGLLGSAVNMVTGTNLGTTAAGNVLDNLSKKNASAVAKAILAPGAGVSGPTYLSDMLTEKIPSAVGSRAGVPLASMLVSPPISGGPNGNK